jgi:oxalate decarboxylase/phosphoglucose isomerase-like protein (cupin superfamily)
MTVGACRVTVLDEKGRAVVQDVKAGDLWYFPAGLPHSLQGLAPDGAEFVLAFDNGLSSEYNRAERLNGTVYCHKPGEFDLRDFNKIQIAKVPCGKLGLLRHVSHGLATSIRCPIHRLPID